MSANDGFRLGIKAGVWYQDIGVSVEYKPVIGKNLGQVPMYKFYANMHFGEVLIASRIWHNHFNQATNLAWICIRKE